MSELVISQYVPAHRFYNEMSEDEVNDRSVILKHIVDILTKYGMNDITTAIITRAPYINYVPTETFIHLHLNDICENIKLYNAHNAYSEHLSITRKQDIDFIRKYFIRTIIYSKPRVVNGLYNIPLYNLFHAGNICHFNTCINVLSSLTELVKEMYNITCSKNVNEAFKQLTQMIINSYSELDMNAFLSETLLRLLNISQIDIDEATESMKKLLNIIYAEGIDKSMIFYWDTTDDFVNDKEVRDALDIPEDQPVTFANRIAMFKPQYLVINVHDLNVIRDKDETKTPYMSFDVNGKYRYTLSSIVMYAGYHYIAAFNTDPFANAKTYIIKNDLMPRYTTRGCSVDDIFIRNGEYYDYEHTLACYIRSNVTK